MAKLRKELHLYGLTMVAIGACIGSGIFLTPSQIAQALPSPTWILLVWIVGGLVALAGALTFAELGGLFPKSGGVYVFLREAYGDVVAFLYGWVTMLVITSGAIAALSIGCAYYVGEVINLSDNAELIFASGAIILVTFINILGVNISQIFANVFTGLKLIGILGIVAVGLWWATQSQTPVDFSLQNSPDNLISAFLLAFIGVFWSYGGWHHASYLAGEAKNAKQTIPLAMILGVLVVMTMYVLTNVAYLYLLPVDTIANSKEVAADALRQVTPIGGTIMAILVAISTFGTMGIYTLSAPRIYFAMAVDKVFFKQMAYIHPTYKVPTNAIILQSIIALILLFLWGTFKDIITYVVFIDLIFMILAAASVFIFRRTKSDAPRSYTTWGYPIIPLFFILVASAFVINTFIERPGQSLAGLTVLLAGLPFYYIFKRNQ